MYKIIVSEIQIEPDLSHSYLVGVKIEVEDSGFREKIRRYGSDQNTRVACRERGMIWSAISQQELDVYILQDEYRIEKVGYFDDYISDDHIFGFETESEAEEFKEKVEKVLTRFLKAKAQEYEQANSRAI